MQPEKGFHSGKLLTNIALKGPSQKLHDITGIKPQEIQTGALLTASNKERKVFFSFTAVVISWINALLMIPVTAILILLCLLIQHGINWGLVLCMPVFITMYLSNSLDKKARLCSRDTNHVARQLISFSRGDMALVLIKAALSAFALVTIMMWLVHTHTHG